jgi:hypothetical protein
MYRTLKPKKDAYITDRVIKSVRSYDSNVGAAGSLDLFKLYGTTMSGSYPNIELSRLLIQFDLQPLRDLVSAGTLDMNNRSFSCTLKLFDVYGGQPTPANFTATVFPLSRSFDEGLGRDVVFYADKDVCNFLTGSRAQGVWLASGCNLGGGLPAALDFITASASGIAVGGSQLFVTGEENLEVDITTAISATISGQLPDEGFRIAFDQSIENNNRTYFVKRFASRTAFNEDKRPKIIVKYDDSIQDDSQSFFLDSTNYLFMYNYNRSTLSNITSGSALTQITGSNSLILKLSTEISGGTYEFVFTGSQHTRGINPVTGIYSASVYIPSTNSVIIAKLQQSSSIKLTPIWGSLDGTVPYLTGSVIDCFPPQRGSRTIDTKKLVVSAIGVKDTHPTDDSPVIKIHIFDYTSPLISVSRLPVELHGVIIRDVHYQVRDAVTGLIAIPFDTVKNSTRLSNDAYDLYFKLDMSSLTKDRTYVIDILIVTGSDRQVYKDVSKSFRVTDL